jgi:2-dehydropantoate 2-reductase
MILVMGAGAVGCWLGGCLQAGGADVVYVGRPRVLSALSTHGLALTDLDGRDQRLPPEALKLSETVPPLAPSLVLLTVKSGATREATRQLAETLPAGTVVVSMQNGISNAQVAQESAPSLVVLPGMVPYNIAELGPGRYHRGTGGALAACDHEALRTALPQFERAGLKIRLHADLKPVLWGKLLLNLNNPVNALSGLPLRSQLLDAGYRRCLAALQDEALGVLDAAGIVPAQIGAAPPRKMPVLLRLPTPVFRLVASRMLRIDAQARSSMADDVALGRPTEIDALCGEVVRLARSIGIDAPRNARMVGLLSAARPQTVPSRQLWRLLQAA